MNVVPPGAAAREHPGIRKIQRTVSAASISTSRDVFGITRFSRLFSSSREVRTSSHIGRASNVGDHGKWDFEGYCRRISPGTPPGTLVQRLPVGGRCLVLYRQVRRRRAFGWTGKFPAGALAIGGFGRSRWRLRRTRRSLSFSMLYLYALWIFNGRFAI